MDFATTDAIMTATKSAAAIFAHERKCEMCGFRLVNTPFFYFDAPLGLNPGGGAFPTMLSAECLATYTGCARKERAIRRLLNGPLDLVVGGRMAAELLLATARDTYLLKEDDEYIGYAQVELYGHDCVNVRLFEVFREARSRGLGTAFARVLPALLTLLDPERYNSPRHWRLVGIGHKPNVARFWLAAWERGRWERELAANGLCVERDAVAVKTYLVAECEHTEAAADTLVRALRTHELPPKMGPLRSLAHAGASYFKAAFWNTRCRG